MNENFIHQEIPVEALRSNISIITGDNSVLISAGNSRFYASSVATCRFASELTFKPIAVCFLRPQNNILRFLDKNEQFTLSYFSPEYQHILNSFGLGHSGEKIEPLTTQSGNIYYPQADLVFECRKITDLELILSSEIQTIMASERKMSIYPGHEAPRMYLAEIKNGWHKVLQSLSSDSLGKLLPRTKIRYLYLYIIELEHCSSEPMGACSNPAGCAPFFNL